MSDEEQRTQSPQEIDKEMEFSSMLNNLNEEDKAFAEEELRRAAETDKQNEAASQNTPEDLQTTATQATTVQEMMKYQFKKGMELARERGHVVVTPDGKVREAPTAEDMKDGMQAGYKNTSFGQSIRADLDARKKLVLELSRQEQAATKAKQIKHKKRSNFVSSIIIFAIIVAAAIYFIVKK